MNLSDLKKYSIRQQYRIHFKLRNGLECVVSEHGVAQVPGIQGVPDFNLEEELAAAGDFLIDPVAAPGQKTASRPRSVRREELASLAAAGPGAPAAAEHDDD